MSYRRLPGRGSRFSRRHILPPFAWPSCRGKWRHTSVNGFSSGRRKAVWFSRAQPWMSVNSQPVVGRSPSNDEATWRSRVKRGSVRARLRGFKQGVVAQVCDRGHRLHLLWLLPGHPLGLRMPTPHQFTSETAIFETINPTPIQSSSPAGTQKPRTGDGAQNESPVRLGRLAP